MNRPVTARLAVVIAALLPAATSAEVPFDPARLPTQRAIGPADWFASDVEFMFGAALPEPSGNGWEIAVQDRGTTRVAVLYRDGRAVGSELAWLRDGLPGRIERFDADGQRVGRTVLWYNADGLLRGMLTSGATVRQSVFTTTADGSSVLTHDAEDLIIETYRNDARPSLLEQRSADRVVKQRRYEYDAAGALVQERTLRADPDRETIRTFADGLLVAIREISDGRTTRRETREYDADERLTSVVVTTRGGQRRDRYRYEDEARIVERFIDDRLVQRTHERGAVRVVEHFIDGRLVATARYRNDELVESSGRVE